MFFFFFIILNKKKKKKKKKKKGKREEKRSTSKRAGAEGDLWAGWEDDTHSIHAVMTSSEISTLGLIVLQGSHHINELMSPGMRHKGSGLPNDQNKWNHS